jgi:hypothetical protein
VSAAKPVIQLSLCVCAVLSMVRRFNAACQAEVMCANAHYLGKVKNPEMLRDVFSLSAKLRSQMCEYFVVGPLSR